MIPREPQDAPVRLRAATCFDANLAVLAGAGTGKTSLLVERLLNAIGTATAEMEQVAAITFTQKAAGELRERVAAGFDRMLELCDPDGDAPAPDRARAADRSFAYVTGEAGVEAGMLRERVLRALDALPRATVDTIHGYCATLLREHPIEAGVDPSFEVDQGEHYETVLDRVWDEFLADELGDGAARVPLWTRVLAELSLAQVAAAGRRLAGFLIPQEHLTERREIEATAIFGEEVASLIADIEDLLDRQRGMTAKSVGIFQALAVALHVFCEEGTEAFQQHVAAADDLHDRIRSTNHPKRTKSLRNVTGEEMERLGRRAMQLAKKLLHNEEALMRDLVEALAPFPPRAREALLRRGFVGFDGLLVLARNLLRDHPGVREAVRQRVRMLLVDEFQDTDPLQYEIVLLLGEKTGGRARQAYRAELEPGRLFVVGDPKQSIYRFRGADHAAFRLAIRRIEEQGGEVLRLSSNFRSVPEVLAPINGLFDSPQGTWKSAARSRSGTGGSERYQPEYVPIEAVRDAAGEPRVELWTLDAGEGLRAADRRVAEGLAIADEIERTVRQDGRRYGDVMILLRAFSHLALYLRPLRERGIPFVVDGGREFLKRPEVGHLISVLRALVQPSDPVALLAYLRSPAAGVPDTELAGYALGGGRWDWHRPVDSGSYPAIARAFGMLRELRTELLDLPADRIVQRVLDRTGLLVVSAAAFEGAQRVANLRKLAAAAADLARHGKLSLLEAIEALEEERAADVESDSPLADEGLEAVRVLTVHKAKGLESDVVIVPDLAREEPRSYGGELFRVDVTTLPEGERALALQAGRLRNAAGVYFQEEEERHLAAEEIRVLYVALTRARERLVLVAGDPAKDVRWIEALAPWGFDPAAPPDDGAALAGGTVTHRRVAPAAAPREDLVVLPEGAAEAVKAHDRAWSRLAETVAPPIRSPSGQQPDDEPLGLRARSRDIAKLVGSVVHRALEVWDRGPDEGLLRAGARLARQAAEREKLEARAVEREVRHSLECFLASPLAGRLREVEIAGREVSMLRRDAAGTTWGGSLDLLYREPDGRLVVADYKTDREEDDATLRRLYGDQLRIYAEAVRDAEGLDRLPRAELWLLRHGRALAVEWEPGEPA